MCLGTQRYHSLQAFPAIIIGQAGVFGLRRCKSSPRPPYSYYEVKVMNEKEMINNLIEQVDWWYKIGKISIVDHEAVEEALDELYPNYRGDSSDIVFQVLMSM